MRPFPAMYWTIPGAVVAQLAWTAQPITCDSRSALATAPSGSTDERLSPRSARNHQGTPFSIGTISVSAPIIGRAADAAEARAGALKIGRASCRERVCEYVSSSVVAVQLQQKKKR